MTDIKKSAVEKAKNFAITAHWGQMYGKLPYLHHLDAVANICKSYNLPLFVVAAAYLHDVVEDTDVHANQISEKFGYEVATLVYAVTDEEGTNRKERKAKTYPKILAHPYGVHLKLADRIANLRSCQTAKNSSMFDMYCKEAPGFEDKLRTPGVADDMWAELDSIYGKHKGKELI